MDGNVSYQTIATNLPRDEFSLEDIKEIYRIRWQLEESLKALKVQLELGKIHGRKLETVTQELYAKATIYNITSQCRMRSEELNGLGIFSVMDDEDNPDNLLSVLKQDRFVPAGLIEYHGPAESSAENSETTDPEEEASPSLSAFQAEQSQSADEKTEMNPVLQGIKLPPLEVKLKGYENLFAIPGAASAEAKIGYGNLIPKEGCEYPHKLNFTAAIGIVQKNLFTTDDGAGYRIYNRSIGHQIGIKPNRPDTRKESMRRKVAHARGDYHHSETRMNCSPPGQAA